MKSDTYLETDTLFCGYSSILSALFVNNGKVRILFFPKKNTLDVIQKNVVSMHNLKRHCPSQGMCPDSWRIYPN